MFLNFCHVLKNEIKDWFKEGLIDEIECIPTKDYMRRPCELYCGEEVNHYVSAIEDWENKIPLEMIRQIELPEGTFDTLHFRTSLNFLDAMYALFKVTSQERRPKLISWIVNSYDESYSGIIEEYRADEHALWTNVKNEKRQIKELYALDSTEKSLEQYFGSNPRIINRNYFPGGETFRMACDILGIPTITREDLEMVPVAASIYTSRNSDLHLFALAIAGVSDAEVWHEKYERYKELLKDLRLHKCEAINITYIKDNSINQKLRWFYHDKDSSDFYFVESLDHKRVFNDFVMEFLAYLGVSENEITKEMVIQIMDSPKSALDEVKSRNNLMLDDAFKEELDAIFPGIKKKLSGKEADDDFSPEDISYAPSFTPQSHQEPDEPKDNSDIGIIGMEDIEEETVGDILEDINKAPNYRPTSNTSAKGERDVEYQEPDEYQDVDGNPEQEPYQSTSEVHSHRRPEEDVESIPHHEKRWDEEQEMPSHHSPRKYPHPENSDRQTIYKYNPIDDLSEAKEKQTFLHEEGNADSKELAHNDELFEGGLTEDEIYDQNTLVRTRMFNDFKEHKLELEMSEIEFLRKSRDKNNFAVKTKSGKFIHVVSAFDGVLYLSPVFWNRVQRESAVICVTLSHKAKNFLYIHNHEELEKIIGNDYVYVKVSGSDKISIVNQLFGKSLTGTKGKIYTMLRVKTGGKSDYLFQPARTEWDEGEISNLDEL